MDYFLDTFMDVNPNRCYEITIYHSDDMTMTDIKIELSYSLAGTRQH